MARPRWREVRNVKGESGFEHVGAPKDQKFFALIKQRHPRDGAALLHAIGVSKPPAPANPGVARQFFPGGCCPPLSEVLPAHQARRAA